jgi:hypothetical protein
MMCKFGIHIYAMPFMPFMGLGMAGMTDEGDR